MASGTTQYGNNIESTTSGTAGSSGTGVSGSVKEGASGIKGALAGVHGMGEKIRGEFNAGVDQAFHEDDSKGVKTAAAGEKEMYTGHFSSGTKEREAGHAGRMGQANTDLNRE